MSKVICIAGESGSGKTTSMRNLDPKSTYYIDADKKGLSWKGWRKQYNKENKNYFACDDANVVRQYIKRIAEACPGVKVIVVDTINGLMVADEMRRSKEKGSCGLCLGFGLRMLYIQRGFDYCIHSSYSDRSR